MAKPKGSPDVVGKRVYALRIALNLSQGQLAKLAGYDSYQSIQSIESGKSKRPTRLRELAKALRTTEAYLLGETETASRPDRTLYSLGSPPHPAAEGIPQVPLKALSAAELSDNRLIYARPDVQGYWHMPVAYMREMGVRPRFHIAVVANDLSMSPKIEYGDIVFVDLGLRDASETGTFLIAYPNGDTAFRLVKLAFNHRIRRQEYVVSCVDPNFRPLQTFSTHDVRILGRCFGSFSLL